MKSKIPYRFTSTTIRDEISVPLTGLSRQVCGWQEIARNMTEFDINTVFGVTISELLKTSVSSFVAKLSNISRKNHSDIEKNLYDYCSKFYLKAGLVKTLIARDKSCLLSKVYVDTHFLHDSKRVSDKEVIELAKLSRKIVIRGNGGCGKTFFMKHLWMEIFRSDCGKLPILVELRKLSNLSELNISTFIRGEINSEILFDERIFDKLCRNGMFYFIFDGFDEVLRKDRSIVERQILDLSNKFPSNSFVVSGRPDDRFDSWHEFWSFNVLPLERGDVIRLIENLDFEPKIQKKFIQRINSEIFEKHLSFLSSPLLSVLMLITFRDNATIPENLNTFYEHAFITLFNQHDALKDSFVRDRSLSFEEFRKLFSTFCLFSYFEGKTEFNDVEFRFFIDHSINYHKMQISTERAIDDIQESVNLVYKDGLKYTFIHRSFQEYFSAFCTVSIFDEKRSGLFEIFASRREDATLQLCYEMSPELVIRHYISPLYFALSDHDVLTPVKNSTLSAFAKIYEEIGFGLVQYGNSYRKGVIDIFIHLSKPNDAKTWDFLFSIASILGKKDELRFLLQRFQNALIETISNSVMNDHDQNSTPRASQNLYRQVRLSILLEDEKIKFSARNLQHNKWGGIISGFDNMECPLNLLD